MTMPGKIYAIDARKRPDDSPSGVWSERRFTTREAYIRADIVAELVGSLEWVSDYLDEGLKLSAQKTIHTALSRINPIMEGK